MLVPIVGDGTYMLKILSVIKVVGIGRIIHFGHFAQTAFVVQRRETIQQSRSPCQQGIGVGKAVRNTVKILIINSGSVVDAGWLKHDTLYALYHAHNGVNPVILVVVG